MNNCICGCNGNVMAEILAVKSEEYIEPEKSGTFESISEVMNDFERQIFTVMERYKFAIKEKFDLIESGEIKIKEKSVVEAEIKTLDDKRDMLRGLLYFSIQDRLNLWGIPRLGVSAGFKIIIPEGEANSEGGTTTIAIPLGMILNDLRKFFSKAADDGDKKGNDGIVH